MLGTTNLGDKWKCGELEAAPDNGWQESKAPISVMRLGTF